MFIPDLAQTIEAALMSKILNFSTISDLEAWLENVVLLPGRTDDRPLI
ncbi:hypothetical protein [Leptolyngbya sp. 'hensonii']|nr:hypothetical protein [Leptolyngbya sp. 'hensonii']